MTPDSVEERARKLADKLNIHHQPNCSSYACNKKGRFGFACNCNRDALLAAALRDERSKALREAAEIAEGFINKDLYGYEKGKYWTSPDRIAAALREQAEKP